MMIIKRLCHGLAVLGLFVVLPAHGQDSDLKKLVDAIRQARTPNAPTSYPAPPPPGITRDAPLQTMFFVFLDDKKVSDQVLNEHTLSEISEVALRFDPAYEALYGSTGTHGLIVITSFKNKPKK